MLRPSAHHDPAPPTSGELHAREAAAGTSAYRRARSGHGIEGSGGSRFDRGFGWYVTFVMLALVLSVALGLVAGVDAIAATARFAWNVLAVVANGAIRGIGSLLLLLAKGVGWRRLSRLAATIMGVGLSYSGGVVLSDRSLQRARGWTGKLKLLAATLRQRWLRLHLGWKLAIVAALVASQVYLHFLLILFPIAFLVPVVRRVWVRAADLLFGRWYWKTFGPTHRKVVASMRRQPGVRHIIGGVRLLRIRYLRAWRLWKYDPRYRDAETGQHEVSFIEPVRLWWRGELDGYVGRHLLGGGARSPTPKVLDQAQGAAD